MLITLLPQIVEKLSTVPEAGMGYQIVEIVLRDGRHLRGLEVIDSTLLNIPDRMGHVEASDIVDIRPDTNS